MKQSEISAATRQNMVDAFWTLYQTKSIDKISINEITRLSGNNRTTFYNYFLDVYDLLEQEEKALVESVDTEIKERFSAFDFAAERNGDFKTVLTLISPVFVKHEEKIFLLLGSNGDPKFTEYLRKRLKENLMKFSLIPADTENIDYILTFIYSAVIGMLGFWHEKGHDLSNDDFISLAHSLTVFGVQGTVGKKGAENNGSD